MLCNLLKNTAWISKRILRCSQEPSKKGCSQDRKEVNSITAPNPLSTCVWMKALTTIFKAADVNGSHMTRKPSIIPLLFTGGRRVSLKQDKPKDTFQREWFKIKKLWWRIFKEDSYEAQARGYNLTVALQQELSRYRHYIHMTLISSGQFYK